MYSSLIARLPWRFTPDSASGLLRVLVVLLFSIVSGGNRLVGMQGVHKYLGYIGHVGRLWRCICMYVLYCI